MARRATPPIAHPMMMEREWDEVFPDDGSDERVVGIAVVIVVSTPSMLVTIVLVIVVCALKLLLVVEDDDATGAEGVRED